MVGTSRSVALGSIFTSLRNDRMNINVKCLYEYISKEHSAAIHRYSIVMTFLLEDIYIFVAVLHYCYICIYIYIYISGDKMEGIGYGGLGALAYIRTRIRSWTVGVVFGGDRCVIVIDTRKF